jgi:hypothetical protein
MSNISDIIDGLLDTKALQAVLVRYTPWRVWVVAAFYLGCFLCIYYSLSHQQRYSLKHGLGYNMVHILRQVVSKEHSEQMVCSMITMPYYLY